jgi:hypothetical protein
MTKQNTATAGARTQAEVSLYEALKAAGIQTGSHESDLYFPASPEALAILNRYPLKKGNATRFTNQAAPNVGERWVDVPFAYDPFWNKKA